MAHALNRCGHTPLNVMAASRKATYIFAIALTLAVLGIYLPGLRNELLFDDLRLSDGTIFGEYGSLLQFKQRLLSYGSFVWLQNLVGEGWWKQRIFNIVLHLGTVAALYALLKALLEQAKFPKEFEEQAHFGASRTAALQVGVALFALNPVAVYAVGYLVQRSIVMATLFAVLACWLFVRGLQTNRAGWYGASLVSYVFAMLSKEYAVMTVAMTVPLYVYIRRPSWKAIAALTGGSLFALALAGIAFWLAPQGRWKTAFGILGATWVAFGTLRFLWSRWKMPGARLTREMLGMSLAHIGIAVFLTGAMLVEGLNLQREAAVRVGDTVTLGDYCFKLTGVQDLRGPNYTAERGTVEVARDCKQRIATVHPEKRRYVAGGQVMTEAALLPGATRDLFIALGESLGNDAWALRVHIKPFVRWIWLGALLMALGAVVTATDPRFRKIRKEAA